MGLRLIYLINIPGSSLGVLSDTVPHDVRRIPWTSRDPPSVSPQTQSPMLSGGFLAQPGILPWCPGPHAVWRIPWTSRDPPLVSPWISRDPPLVSPQTQAPMLSGGSPGDPGILPWCPFRHGPPAVRRIPWTSKDPPFMSPSDTGPQAVWRIPGSKPFIHFSSRKVDYMYLCD